MNPRKVRFLFLNIGHFLDHFFILIFATVAALQLTEEWSMRYSELIPYATPGLVVFGLCALPAGWLADKWSREGMMVVFFIGIGASSILASFSDTPLALAFNLTLIGIFAAIYHPVGLAMVVEGREKTGIPLAVNGVFGNMGVASAALVTGILIDTTGWRSAFVLPGLASIAIGLGYLFFESRTSVRQTAAATRERDSKNDPTILGRKMLARIFTIILFTAALGGLVFQSTTFALPKILDERLADVAGTATLVGFYTFLVFAVAAFAQLVVGYLLDNHSVRAIFAVVAILQSALFLVMIPLSGLAALIVALGFMLLVFGEIPIIDVLVGRIARSEWRSRAYALKYLVTFGVSATAVPVIALIHGIWGFDVLFGVLSVIAAGIFIAVLLLPREGVDRPTPTQINAA